MKSIRAITRTDFANGIGDMALMPFRLNWGFAL